MTESYESYEKLISTQWRPFQLTLLMLYTGKTLLAKAVANQTSATFLRVVGSELIQKYLVSFTQLSLFCWYVYK